jgi:hypothetical protein
MYHHPSSTILGRVDVDECLIYFESTRTYVELSIDPTITATTSTNQSRRNSNIPDGEVGFEDRMSHNTAKTPRCFHLNLGYLV